MEIDNETGETKPIENISFEERKLISRNKSLLDNKDFQNYLKTREDNQSTIQKKIANRIEYEAKGKIQYNPRIISYKLQRVPERISFYSYNKDKSYQFIDNKLIETDDKTGEMKTIENKDVTLYRRTATSEERVFLNDKEYQENIKKIAEDMHKIAPRSVYQVDPK
jgi:hypothetical protein